MNEASGGKTFATWCVMTHARPALVSAPRAWGPGGTANKLEQAAALNALKKAAMDIASEVRKVIRFVPLRRDLAHAANTLHAAATFASRGDGGNTAAVVIGVFTNAGSALAWRRPWLRLAWRKRRAEIIAEARREQSAYLAAPVN